MTWLGSRKQCTEGGACGLSAESRDSADTKHEEEVSEREALLYSESGKATDTASGCRWHLPAFPATDGCEYGRKCRIKNLRIGDLEMAQQLREHWLLFYRTQV